MQTSKQNSSISAISESIDIPDYAYDQAETRYNDLGEWLGRPESAVHKFDPEIFPQGSFLLGTVTHPLNKEGEYDLDLSVKLRKDISKSTHIQYQLKKMIGDELESYRTARGIQESLEEKRRCWRLEYQDQLSFHLDIVPCIPEDEQKRREIKEAMSSAKEAESMSDEISSLTVSITDTKQPEYNFISNNWNVSNPQGYGRWFASRVRLAKQTIFIMEKRAEVEELPTNKLKAPLQRCVQILKLHRDNMFKEDPERAPISVIITTLAARAYQGQENVGESLIHIVKTMEYYVNNHTPRVPNPVNPKEDFSDKWYSKEGRALGLEENFRRWLYQAKVDFGRMAEMQDVDELTKLAENSLGLKVSTSTLRKNLGQGIAISTPAISDSKSSNQAHKTRIKNPPKPWAAM